MGAGAKVQVALTVSNEFGSSYSEGIGNAVAMAVAMRPTIRGFPVQVEHGRGPYVPRSVGRCGDRRARRRQLPERRGHRPVLLFRGALLVACLRACGDRHDLRAPPPPTISPALAPTVFDRVVMDGPAGSSAHTWFTTVVGLPSVTGWTQYHAAFPPSAPTSEFDAFYFDAATLLLDRLQEVSRLMDGNPVIDREELAKAVRRTTDFAGVTCTIRLEPATGNRVDDAASLARCAG